MAKYTMDMILEYARIFPENADMGDPEGSRTAQMVHQKGGQYTTHVYFTDEEQIQHLVSEGLDLQPMNSDRIKAGNQDYGVGKYMKVKRLISDVKNFVNRKGEDITIDYGGAPTVVNLTEGKEKKRLWNYEEDGTVGNGSKAKVQFEVYANGAGVRLLNVGITEHVIYDNEAISEDDELFIV